MKLGQVLVSAMWLMAYACTDNSAIDKGDEYIWAGKFESTGSLYSYCDGATSPTSSVTSHQVVIGTVPRLYFLEGGAYKTLVTADATTLVAEVVEELREQPTARPYVRATRRTVLSRNPPVHSETNLDEYLNPETEPACKQSGYLFVGPLNQIDTVNRSCKELAPPCP